MTSQLFSRSVILWAALLVVFAPVLPISATVTYETRALTGDAAPGTAAGVVYRRLSTPSLNGSGQTTFRGVLTGTGVDGTNNFGLWSEGSGSLSLVVREGDAAPGTDAGVVFDIFDPNRVLNGSGQTAFWATLMGEGVDLLNNHSLWSEGSGSLSLVAREGSAAPGTAEGVVYGRLEQTPALNDAGQTAFWGFLGGEGVDGTNNTGIWSESSGSLGLVARAGEAAPGTAAGVVYGSLENSPPVLNGAGQSAFRGTLTGTGVDGTKNNTGLWSESSGSLGLVARAGEAAPGTAAGVVYSSLEDSPVLNDAGQTAFRGTLSGTGVDGTNNTGIWSEGSGSLSLVARAGDAAPGTAAGVVYSSLEDSPVLNGAGQTAFGGTLTGTGVDVTNDTGIWSESSASLGLVARAGEAAPGTAAGVVFSSFGDPVLNGAGQTAFSGILSGPGVNLTNRAGIWATDPDGLLTLIAREGDLFDVNDDPVIDDLRTISSTNLIGTASGGEDGRGSYFNDAGQLAFNLRFTDNSEGIFVFVPEPAGLPCDLGGSAECDHEDIDILADAVRNAISDPKFDVNGSGSDIPDNADFKHYITDAAFLGTLEGDHDLNKIVNFVDFVALSNNFQMTGLWLTGNGNTDTVTNFDDFVLISNNFNMMAASGANVPEPMGAALLGLSGMALAWGRFPIFRRGKRC